ncbi:MAG: esterase [Candidatus Lokiarchaeota archaeon]|nr:esterase [Candidatus Lokiarchaeota archaeon]
MIKVQNFKIETELVPSPAKYSVLYPSDYETSDKTYSLMLFLHGGDGHSGILNQIKTLIRDLWKKKLAPEMVLVIPHCDRSFYMDYRNGSQKWETFILNEVLPLLQNKFRVYRDPSKSFLGGVSMGGMGTLRIGFKYPGKFGVLLAFEPAIEPALEWKDVKTRDKFYRSKEVMETIFGSPFDEEYWKMNNPLYIARENADKIRKSDIKIYIEVGTEDMLGLYRGAEFIHRILFDKKIRHEFRIVYGADHIGPSLKERFINGFSFLNRVINNPKSDLDVVRNLTKDMLERAKK